jgi:hypothetical protein
MFEYLKRLRNRPEHVRKNVALGAAGALTLLVALGWGAATIAGGSLALAPTSLTPDDSAPVVAAVAQTSSTFSQLLGAVGAAATGASTTPPAVEVVSDRSQAPAVATTTAYSQTVIPF